MCFLVSSPKAWRSEAASFFTAEDGYGLGLHSNELWTSDGTSAGTGMLKDINPGDSNSNITFLTIVNGFLYFTADDGVHGVELWKYDGTATGTVLVKDVNPGSGTAFPSFNPQLTNINGTLYFQADDGERMAFELSKCRWNRPAEPSWSRTSILAPNSSARAR